MHRSMAAFQALHTRRTADRCPGLAFGGTNRMTFCSRKASGGQLPQRITGLFTAEAARL